jgi:hypothetical protein
MTNPFRIFLLALPLTLGACAHPLEHIADASRQSRIDAANANRSLTHGASDGLGSYIAKGEDDGGGDARAQR